MSDKEVGARAVTTTNGRKSLIMRNERRRESDAEAARPRRRRVKKAKCTPVAVTSFHFKTQGDLMSLYQELLLPAMDICSLSLEVFVFQPRLKHQVTYVHLAF